MSVNQNDVLIKLRNYLRDKHPILNQNGAVTDYEVIIKGTGVNPIGNIEGGKSISGTSFKRIYLTLINSQPMGNSWSAEVDAKSSETLYNHTIQLQFWFNTGIGYKNKGFTYDWSLLSVNQVRELLKLEGKSVFFDEYNMSVYVNDDYQITTSNYDNGSDVISVAILTVDIRGIFKFTIPSEMIESVDLDKYVER